MPVNAILKPFLRRSLLPVLFLFMGLLLVSNLFLLMTRPSVPVPGTETVRPVTGNEYPPLAFGAVVRPFAPASKFHQLASPAAYTYVTPNDLLPAIPPQMNLYRDQGIVLETAVFDRLLRSVGIQAGDQLHLVPTTVDFETPDGVGTVSVDVARRQLTVIANAHTPPALTPPADAELTEMARAFARDYGMRPDTYDTPSLVRGTGTGATKLPAGFVEVRWPMKADVYPVFDQYGKPVIGMSAVLNAKTGVATQLMVRLVSPAMLAASPYPTSPVASLLASVGAGGLTPIRSTPGNAAVNVQYKDAKLAYVLWESDGTLPAYMIPSVVVEADVPLKCPAACEPWHWVSYVPLLDPAHFSWAVTAPVTASGAVTSAAPAKK